MSRVNRRKSRRGRRSPRQQICDSPIEEILRWILVTAALGEMIYYSELIDGVSFDGSWSRTGEPFTVDARKWTVRYLQVVCVALAQISDSILDRHGILISALVVNKQTDEPGAGFFRAAEAAGLLDDDEDRELVWEDQKAAAYAYCQRLAADDSSI